MISSSRILSGAARAVTAAMTPDAAAARLAHPVGPGLTSWASSNVFTGKQRNAGFLSTLGGKLGVGDPKAMAERSRRLGDELVPSLG